MTFKPPNHSNLKIKVIIHYEIFDDVPILTKYLTVEAKEPLSLGFGPLEILSLNWQWSDQGNFQIGIENLQIWYYFCNHILLQDTNGCKCFQIYQEVLRLNGALNQTRNWVPFNPFWKLVIIPNLSFQ